MKKAMRCLLYQFYLRLWPPTSSFLTTLGPEIFITKTNNEGYFTLSVKSSGILNVNSEESNDRNPKFISATFNISPVNDELLIVDIDKYRTNEIISIVLQYSQMEAKFNKIISLYKAKNYKQAKPLASNYINTYRNERDAHIAEVREIEMLSIFDGIINNKQDIYESIISQGKDYIEKYRNVISSRWEEMEKYVNELYRLKRDKEFGDIMSLNKEENYEAIIRQGKDYIEKYRNIKDSQWAEIEKLVKEAEMVRRKKEFLAIKTLTIKEDYESIISQGKEYIEKYRNIADSQWKEIVNLVNKAEQRKKQVEEATRKAAEEERKIAERERLKEEKKEKERWARCNNVIMSMEEFYRNNNPYADKGKCVDVVAASFQMSSANTGLFKISDYSLDLVYIEFKEPFRGRFVKGLAKILGIYSYRTNAGGSNSVPHLKMLEIERIE